MKPTGLGVEIQGMLFPDCDTESVDHAQFLHDFTKFAEEHGWTFFGVTKQTDTSGKVMPDLVPQVEAEETAEHGCDK